MKNLITICQKIGARDTWPAHQVEHLNLLELAAKLIEKYRVTLTSLRGFTPNPEDLHFFYITSRGTTQELGLDQPVAPFLEMEGGSLFWQTEPLVTVNDTATSNKPYWSLSTIISNGCLPIIHNGIWGYIDGKGIIRVQPFFHEAYIQTEGFALVIMPSKSSILCGYITDRGVQIILPENYFSFPFSEGFARVKMRDCWGFIDKTYTTMNPVIAIEAQFDMAGDFSENLAPVEIYSSWGYIDKCGDMKISPRFQFAREFSEGLAPVYDDGAWGFINKSGNYTIKPSFENAWHFHEGLAAIQLDGVFGFIDKNARIVIEPRFEDANIFSQGLANVQVDGKWGYIDKTGTLIIEPQFPYAGPFSRSLAAVQIFDRLGWINTLGKYVWKPQN